MSCTTSTNAEIQYHTYYTNTSKYTFTHTIIMIESVHEMLQVAHLMATNKQIKGLVAMEAMIKVCTHKRAYIAYILETES